MKEKFHISHSFAQMIVDEAKEVIGKDINFIQLDGEIITRSDPNRIHSFHCCERVKWGEGRKCLGVCSRGNLVFFGSIIIWVLT
ncbi:sugar diacid recognition domain-containing protein [Metabacillus rhizolycopersici]|uniref:Putative sugar diacid recognition domain-containing protein n=1 Tax=Metabacillus rhizolycopersici TaxID=2875709 RepID=A0ABS7UM32_9BACI|nr:hypothetical protein [Metabacillus rhizolycopersici]